MKKISVFISILYLGITNSFSQDSIPNAGFENWTINAPAASDEPVGWGTANAYPNLDSCVSQSKTAGYLHSGASGIVLTTQKVTHNFGGSIGIKTWKVAGTAVCGGQINNQLPYITGGIKYIKRPTSLKGYCKYVPQQSTDLYNGNPVGIDVSNVEVYFFKLINGKRDTVGRGQLSPANSTYSEFTVPITYKSSFTGNPDSVQIILASSKGLETAQGSKLYVDDLKFDFTPAPVDSTIGIETFDLNKFDLKQNAPNPFCESTNIQFNCMTGERVVFEVVDFLGREVYYNAINAQSGINTITFNSKLAPGTYIYSISNAQGRITKKMVVIQ